MIRKERLSILTVLIFSLILQFSGLAHSQLADTPWPMFMHDSMHTGQSLHSGPGTHNNSGRYQLTSHAGYLVIGADGTIYSPSGGEFFAINPDFSSKWVFDGQGGGFASCSPALDSNGTIYMPGYNSFLAINSDGTLKWEYRAENTFCYSSPTIGADGTIYVGNNIDLLAIRSDGTLGWSYRVGEDINASPAICSDGTIYIRSVNDYLCAVNPDGTEKWKISFNDGVGVSYSSPVIGSDGTIYTYGLTTEDRIGLLAFDPNGVLKWECAGLAFGNFTPAIGSDGTIYVAETYNDLHAINPDSGAIQWTYDIPLGEYFRSSPVVDSNGVIYIGTSAKTLLSIFPNGRLRWRADVGGDITSIAIGSDQKIYIGTSDGYIKGIGDLEGFTVSPDSFYDFGAVDVGTISSGHRFTFTHTENQSHTIENFIICGENASEFSLLSNTCSGTTIVANESCTTDIAFSPTSAGLKKAYLCVETTEDPFPMLLTLTGAGMTSDPGAISGRVYTDIAGHQELSVANATITIEGTDYETTTNSNGDFTLQNVQPGEYTLKISAPNFVSITREILLLPGQNLVLVLPTMTISNIKISYDINGDGKTGLEEAIHALQIVSGVGN